MAHKSAVVPSALTSPHLAQTLVTLPAEAEAVVEGAVEVLIVEDAVEVAVAADSTVVDVEVDVVTEEAVVVVEGRPTVVVSGTFRARR